MAPTRLEWTVADWACQTQSIIPVPLYDTLGPDSSEYIVNHAGLCAVICSRDVLEKVGKKKIFIFLTTTMNVL